MQGTQLCSDSVIPKKDKRGYSPNFGCHALDTRPLILAVAPIGTVNERYTHQMHLPLARLSRYPPCLYLTAPIASSDIHHLLLPMARPAL